VEPAAADNHWHGWVAEQVRLHGPLLFRLAFDVLKDAAKAEDVCQEVAVKALQMQATIRDPQAIKGWLARVVRTRRIAEF
jgi:RNA polymerase sigma-70 factor (ECF subfamily)